MVLPETHSGCKGKQTESDWMGNMLSIFIHFDSYHGIIQAVLLENPNKDFNEYATSIPAGR
jgi:hypothetical protein